MAHGHNGLRWDPRRPSTILEAAAVMHDAGIRRELAARARPSVEARSWDAVGDQLLEHYGRLVPVDRSRGAA